jgi:cell division protein FtsA
MIAGSGLTPRLKPLSARKGATLSVLDVGTSKVVCLVAELLPAAGEPASSRGRTHLVRVVGIGHQRSQGLKGGAIVDLEAAEGAIRQAVHAAERMARVEIRSVIVNLTGGRLASRRFAADTPVRGGPVGPDDVARVLGAASAGSFRPNRATLHALPMGYSLDGAGPIADPLGMVGDKLGVDLHVVTAEAAAARNLMLAVERCHLDVEAVIATPYAAGLSALVDDEAEMGAVVIDLGGGTTSVGVFGGGQVVHADAVAVGGHHITMDIARGLSTRIADAERLKVQHGSAILAGFDERDTIPVPQVDEDERDISSLLPKSHLARIIRPRVEEILELVRDRLKSAGFAEAAGRRVVLTGGGSQLPGLPEVARQGAGLLGRGGASRLPGGRGPGARRAPRRRVLGRHGDGWLLLAGRPLDSREFLTTRCVNGGGAAADA